jgi:hypothetical protein
MSSELGKRLSARHASILNDARGRATMARYFVG